MPDKKAYVGEVILKDEVLSDGVVVTDGGTITWVGPLTDLPDELAGVEQIEFDADSYIMPGLVDVHCHGGGGASFPDATTLDDVRAAAGEHLKHGTTTMIASLVTAAIPVLEEKGALLADAVDEGIIAGFHYEGPFISKEKCGAQNPKYIVAATPDDARKLVEAGRGNAVTITIAPEQCLGDEGKEALGILIDGDILPSWGHTNATTNQTVDAIDMGIDLLKEAPEKVRGGRGTVTHLFNGMPPMHHRSPGPIPAFMRAAAKGELFAELINDGIHVDPLMVGQVVAGVGRENCVYVTDSMAAAGMPDGEYVLGPQEVRVKHGVARLLHGDALAGGTSHLLDQVRIGYQIAGLPLVDSVYLATRAGADVLGNKEIGRLEAGSKADLLITTKGFDVLAVIGGGKQVA